MRRVGTYDLIESCSVPTADNLIIVGEERQRRDTEDDSGTEGIAAGVVAMQYQS